MLFRQLEYFATLARERHFARAAQACYVSQPALSEAIRKLEHELKVPLIRRGRSFEGLTPEGERLVWWARRILADHSALQQEVGALRTGLTGDLRLGVVPAAASTVALLTDPFCAEHPLVHVQIRTSLRSDEIIERIHRFELDAGVIHLDGSPATELAVTPLYEEQHVLIANRELLAGRSPVLSWSDALELPICLLHAGMRGRQLVDDALTERGLTATPQLEADSVVALLAHVGTGRWATIVPESWLRTLRSPAGAHVLPLEEAPITARIGLVTSAVEPASMLTSALVRTARGVDFGGSRTSRRTSPAGEDPEID